MSSASIKTILISCCSYFIHHIACAQFAPPAGQTGTTAMYKDSADFISWATGCTINRGYADISNPGGGYATLGDSTLALGQAGANATVSLGDGGSAVLTFAQPIIDGPGNDFAVFENAFSDNFLEFAFVEVSSDGQNFFRFPATSNIQDTAQTSSFGPSDASLVNNLAGKYRALYGTPFDLQELSGIAALDVTSITHVKIVDVVGSINPLYATYDVNGKKVNDPWPTAFASGGFDLDAVGVIHEGTTGIKNNAVLNAASIFPNPAGLAAGISYRVSIATTITIKVYDLIGSELVNLQQQATEGAHYVPLNTELMAKGVYLVFLSSPEYSIRLKLIKE